MRARTIIRRAFWTLLALATLIAVFYTEEDWRGARALRSAEAEWTARRGSLNYASYVPAPIPERENLAALPVFLSAPDPQDRRWQRPLALERALRRDEDMPTRPRLGDWQQGLASNMTDVRAGVAALYAAAFPGARAPASALAQLDDVYPFLEQLRDASLTRTRCRFDFNYDNPLIMSRFTLLMTDQIELAQLLALHGVLALHEQ